jgi:D-alanyl-lipoteichoic acid acyltransferase DltB (MBOAT superfamily)
MGFNSLIYLIFLAATAVVYYVLPGRYRWILLLIASVGYYLSFIPIFLSLLVVVVILNFFMAQWLTKATVGKTKRIMILIVFLNILILAFFKYFNFFFPGNYIHLYNVDWFFRTDPINKMILPLGLSYLIFTVLSYQIEVKRKTIPAEKHLGYFSLYLLFFPRIAQGPIERPQNLIPQLRQAHSFDYDMIVEGMKLMLWGYFKKLVVADRLAIYVNAVYNNSDQHNGTTLLIATVFFAFQIYADFSGYTDIALGSAKIFGFNLTNNFKRPYFATSITEFWNRWHITFSTWLRDYIFLPLAFFLSDRMKKQKYLFIKTEKWIYLIAIMVTFAICGLWHGEGWTYILWGLLFGVYLTWSNWTEKLNKKIRKQLHIKKTTPVYVFYKVVLTFILVSFTWIFFRAVTLKAALSIIYKIFTFKGNLFIGEQDNFFYSIIAIMLLLLAEFKLEYFSGKYEFFQNKSVVIRYASYLFIVVYIGLFGVFDGGQFIYFQF